MFFWYVSTNFIVQATIKKINIRPKEIYDILPFNNHHQEEFLFDLNKVKTVFIAQIM